MRKSIGARTSATMGGVAAILLWSTTIAMGRSLAEQLGPVTAGAAVCGMAGALSVFGWVRRGRTGERVRNLPRKYLLGCGCLFTGYMLLLFLAVGWARGRQQALEVGLLNYLWPVLTLLLSTAVLGGKVRWAFVPGTGVALAGIVLVLSQGAVVSWASFSSNVTANPAAYGCATAAAFAWALYSVLTRKWAGGERTGAVDVFLPVTAVWMSLLCLLLDEARTLSVRVAIETAFLGGATYAAYGLWDRAMRGGDVVLVAAASYLTPLFSTVVSCVYLRVAPEATLWFGAALLVAGSVISWRAASETAAEPEPGTAVRLGAPGKASADRRED